MTNPKNRLIDAVKIDDWKNIEDQTMLVKNIMLSGIERIKNEIIEY